MGFWRMQKLLLAVLRADGGEKGSEVVDAPADRARKSFEPKTTFIFPGETQEHQTGDR